MTLNNSALRQLFSQFRNPAQQAKEQAYLENAIQIGHYVYEVDSIEQIKGDFVTGGISSKAIELDSRHKKRTFGAILYGKLALDEYTKNKKNFNDEELRVLASISSILGMLYSDLKGNKNQLHGLLQNAQHWLEHYAPNSAEKKPAHKLCQGLYTMLTCLNIAIEALPPFQKSLMGAELIATTTKGISQLLTSIESTAHTLEATITPPEVAEATQDSAKSMQDHINERYLAIFNQTDQDHRTRLRELEVAANKISSDIKALREKKKEFAAIEETRKALESLFNAATENDSRVSGRLYFQDFVNQNREQFDIFLQQLTQEQRDLFDTDMQSITNPTLTQIAKATALSLASWVAAPVTTLARTFISAAIMEGLGERMPETQDSDCKARLKTLAQETLATIKQQMQEKQSEIEVLETTLNEKTGAPLALIKESQPQDLADILTTNQATIDLARNSLGVIIPIKAQLKALQDLDSHFTDFIEENDTTFKKFCDFFARFGEWFSTPSLSQKIAEVRELKSKLLALQSETEKLTEKMLGHTNSSVINERVKTELAQLSVTPSLSISAATDSTTGQVGIFKAGLVALSKASNRTRTSAKTTDTTPTLAT